MSINLNHTLSLHLFMLGSSLIYAFFKFYYNICQVFTVAIYCQLQSAYYVTLRNYF